MADPSSPFRERWESAYSGSAPRRQNDLVAEMAFGLYCTSISKNTEVDALSEADCETAFRQASQRIAILRRLAKASLLEITPAHREDAYAIARRLRRYLTGPVSSIVIQPLLPGVGMINSCYADLMGSEELIEIKMGASPFRTVDLRQLLTYCALAHASSAYAVRSCALVNPRTGLTWRFPLSDLIAQISDLSTPEFFEAFLAFIDDDHT